MASKTPGYLNSPKTPSVCPVCGEDVPARALACPECGADDRSGWNADANSHDGAGVPDEDFNYKEFVDQEFGHSPKPVGLRWIWWATAVLLLLALLYTYFQTGGRG